MHNLDVIINRQARAVIREWEEAVANRDCELARRIQEANPDIFAKSPVAP